MLALIILVMMVERSLGCFKNYDDNIKPQLLYGEDAPEPVNDPGIEDPRFLGNLSDPSVWVHNWQPPKAYSPQNYKKWITDYKKKLKENEARNQESWENDPNNPEKSKGWPPGWKSKFRLGMGSCCNCEDLGPGNPGDAPPPWAIEKDGYGKPGLCFQEPAIGTCKNYHVRFGFNPYKKDCAEFVYSGCGGNENNFLTKKRCREVCSEYPKNLCQGGVASHVHGLTADDVPYLLHWAPPLKKRNYTAKPGKSGARFLDSFDPED